MTLQWVVELYREQRHKTSISHDKLLLKATKEVVGQLWMNHGGGKVEYRWLNTCGKDGILTNATKTRVKMEGAAWEVNGPLEKCYSEKSKVFHGSIKALEKKRKEMIHVKWMGWGWGHMCKKMGFLSALNVISG
ncbi:hypothetical protein ZEAMMB73_Zm00001d049477 [Zea mays]|uniref:Uncharacterized protein n=1 Tax=Zea mays TaxID=4577 RepID=A0A1D6PVM3_MAIZE|nr:hypothetical protein ZEAMMB73_Zm00001d049477 [Zea mays]